MVEFKRARSKITQCGTDTIYDSKCGSYRMIKSSSTLGAARGDAYSDRWYAIVMHGDNHEHLISRHRKRSATERAITAHTKKRKAPLCMS